MFGLIGEKLGMTQIYDAEGNLVPVTVVRVLPNVVTGVRSASKNGYESVQIGYGEKRESSLAKPQRGFFKKNQLKPLGFLCEFRVESAKDFKVGSELRVELFKVGDVVDVQGHSKGKGFQGVMKRWHFSGGMDSHGCSVSHRAPGSIGQRAYPGRVMRGQKMAGHMGDDNVTIQNLRVVGVEAEQNLLLIRGALPGAKTGRIYIYNQAQDFVTRALLSQSGSDKAVA